MNFDILGFALPIGGIDPIFIAIFVVTLLVSIAVSSTLKARFRQHSQVPIQYTGAQIAERMLRESGIKDVKVVHVPGHLTDHYDPVKKTVNLSEMVYHHNSVAAAAVAAHECGHAVQHAKSYMWLTMRSKMVPAVQFSSQMLNFILIASLLGAGMLNNPAILWVYVGLFAVTTLFSFVTLPVEFDASKRALQWLESSGSTVSMEHEKAKNALFWAAMTYVAGALGSLAMLAYYLFILLGRRD